MMSFKAIDSIIGMPKDILLNGIGDDHALNGGSTLFVKKEKRKSRKDLDIQCSNVHIVNMVGDG